MSGSKKVLIFGGVALAALALLYGLHYAVFVEHQTLDRMGGALVQGFVSAAQQKPAAAHDAIDRYANAKYDYVRELDAHSHWIGLAMLMIVMGVAFDWVELSERFRMAVACGLTLGAFAFPLAVILQTVTHGGMFAKALAVAGSGLVTIALAAIAWGFWRQAA